MLIIAVTMETNWNTNDQKKKKFLKENKTHTVMARFGNSDKLIKTG